MKAGGVKAVVDAMRAHPTNADMQRYGCGALRALADGNAENKARIGEARGVQAVVDALRAHRTNADVQEYGCFARRKLRRC